MLHSASPCFLVRTYEFLISEHTGAYANLSFNWKIFGGNRQGALSPRRAVAKAHPLVSVVIKLNGLPR